MAHILITGARGFIGHQLARYLTSLGHRVSGIGHGIWPEFEASAWGVMYWLNGDITPGNLRLLQRAVGPPDIVYHLAGGSSVGPAIVNPREDFFRTVASTAELLEWLRLDAPGARLVVASSAAVYGGGHVGPIRETATLTPFSPYGYHKRIMEELCRSYAANYGIQVMTARLFSVYGVGLKKQLLWDLCSKLASGSTQVVLGGSGNELRDWTEVRDVVRALDLLAQHASIEVPVVNVGTGDAISVAKIARCVSNCWTQQRGIAGAIEFNNKSRPGDPFSLIAQSARLQNFGFEWQYRIDDGLADYVCWFLSQRVADL